MILLVRKNYSITLEILPPSLKHSGLLQPIRGMKPFLIMLLMQALFLACISQEVSRENLSGDVPKEFAIGQAAGYRGIIQVRIAMEQGVITEITVIESSEDSAIGGAAIEDLSDLVLMYNSTNIDAVSGATASSKGFLAAIENAIMNL